MIKTTITERYELLETLGQGGNGITYKAEDKVNSQTVAIKILSLEQIDDWKKLDYFEREVQILQQLNHPRIPKYIDYFLKDSQSDEFYHLSSEQSFEDILKKGIQPDRFYLVQELIEGKSFFQLIEEGWKPDEKEVKDIAKQILKILVYLQQLIPPVTHRDIKPHNLIYTENREVFLVDFGAVQDKVRQTTVGSSVVGTYGYMSPEQFRGGKTYSSTDLYGLGTTLIYLLTGKHPTELPQKKLKVDYHNQVKLSTNFRKWLDKLIEPFPEKRLPSAQIALEVLQGNLNLEDQITEIIEKPRESKVKITETPEKLIIDIPCALKRKGWNYTLGWLAVGWNLLVFLTLFVLSLSFYHPFWKILCIIYALILIIKKIIYYEKQLIFIFKISELLLPLFLLFMLNVLKMNHVLVSTHLIAFLILFIDFIIELGINKKDTKILKNLFCDIKITIPKHMSSQKKRSFVLNIPQNMPSQKVSSYIVFFLLSPSEKLWLSQEIRRFLKS